MTFGLYWMKIYAKRNGFCKGANDYIFYLMFATFCKHCLGSFENLNITWKTSRVARVRARFKRNIHCTGKIKYEMKNMRWNRQQNKSWKMG